MRRLCLVLALTIVLALFCTSSAFAAAPWGWTYAYDHWNGSSWVFSQSPTNSTKNWAGSCYYRLGTSLGSYFPSAIYAAASTWSSQDPNFYFYELPMSGDQYDHTLGINYGMPSGQVACLYGSSVWYGGGVAEVGNWYIRFNGNKTWCNGAYSGQYDRQSKATHELGHAIRLMDLDGSWSYAVKPTMYGWWGDNTIGERSLAAGDITGITQLY